MIHEVDEALRSLMASASIGGAGVDVVFDAPTKDWGAHRTTPTLDFYLYDIREEMKRRSVGHFDERNDDGHIVARHEPPRYYRLSYLVTAWTSRAEDEHRLLGGTLGYFVSLDRLPPETLTGSLASLALPVAVSVARPPSDDRQVPEVWSALGGELKPSLDLIVTAPLDSRAAAAAAGLVREPLILETADTSSGARERRQRMPSEQQLLPAAATAPTTVMRRSRGNR